MIAQVPSATDADVDRAVASARAALAGPWAAVSARERGRMLWKLGELLVRAWTEIARLETLHNGKPIFESRHIEMPAAAECLQYYAGWADKVHGETIPVKGNYLAYTLREPVGVVAAIVPWNFPLLLAAWKVAPALACGNTVVLKPASQTPLTAIALGDLALEAGLPPGVLNVITGPGAGVGRAIVEHPGVDKIAFTGDTSTGRAIMQGARDTLKRLTLELGGKSPNIVFADADSTRRCAARRPASSTARGRSARQGRGCWSTGRSRRVHRQARGAHEEDRAGDPLDPKTRLGAIASKEQLETRAPLRRDRRSSEGATLVAGGARADIGTGKGFFVEPTVFDDVTPDMTIAREEIFGPVLATIEFADVDEAIAARERLDVRPRRRGLDAGHQEGPPRRAEAPGRHGLDQHLQRLRHRRAVRRLQAERLRPRDGHARARALHAGEERVR